VRVGVGGMPPSGESGQWGAVVSNPVPGPGLLSQRTDFGIRKQKPCQPARGALGWCVRGLLRYLGS
jgi:hypothetical protein